MSLAYFSRNANRSGVSVSGAVVSVTDSATSSAATIYSDEAGTTEITTLTSLSTGQFEFWVEEGVYDVSTADSGETYTKKNIQIFNGTKTSHEVISLDSVTGADIAVSGTGVNYDTVVKYSVAGLSVVKGSFSNYTMDSDVTIDLAAYMSAVVDVDITRRGTGVSVAMAADHDGTVVTINRINDLDDSTPLYFTFTGIAV